MVQRLSGSRCYCCSGGSSPNSLEVPGYNNLLYAQTCSYSLFHRATVSSSTSAQSNSTAAAQGDYQEISY